MKTTSITIDREVAERARRIARLRGMPLSAYVADLVEADHVATFGEDAEPLISVEVDDAGKPIGYTIEGTEPFAIPSTLAEAFATNVERIATGGGAMLEILDDAGILRVDRKGPAVIIQITTLGRETKKASFGVHRALRIVTRLREVAGVMDDTARAHTGRSAA